MSPVQLRCYSSFLTIPKKISCRFAIYSRVPSPRLQPATMGSRKSVDTVPIATKQYIRYKMNSVLFGII